MSTPLRTLRENLGLTQAEAAAYSGVSLKTWWRWERQSDPPRLAVLAMRAYQMEWQPIETAPRDGTPVLVVGGKLFYYLGDWPNKGEPLSGPAIAQWGCERWRRHAEWLAGHNEDGDAITVEPTHWLPASVQPEPPEQPE